MVNKYTPVTCYIVLYFIFRLYIYRQFWRCLFDRSRGTKTFHKILRRTSAKNIKKHSLMTWCGTTWLGDLWIFYWSIICRCWSQFVPAELVLSWTILWLINIHQWHATLCFISLLDCIFICDFVGVSWIGQGVQKTFHKVLGVRASKRLRNTELKGPNGKNATLFKYPCSAKWQITSGTRCSRIISVDSAQFFSLSLSCFETKSSPVFRTDLEN